LLLYLGAKVDQSERYRDYSIRAFESSPGKWRAEIRKVDGSAIEILLPNLRDWRPSLITEPEVSTAGIAIGLAKLAIDRGSDCGGMR
jgi:hypothetical protein